MQIIFFLGGGGEREEIILVTQSTSAQLEALSKFLNVILLTIWPLSLAGQIIRKLNSKLALVRE